MTCIGFSTLIYASSGLARVRFGDGFQQLMSSMDEKVLLDIPSLADINEGRLPRFGFLDAEPNVMVWGDSHAMAIMPAVDQACKELGLGGVYVTAGGTLPLIGFPNSRPWSQSTEFADATVGLCRRGGIDFAILAGYWHRDAHHPLFERCLGDTIQVLKDCGVKVLIARDVPEQRSDPHKLILAALRTGGDVRSIGVTVQDHRTDQALADAILSEMVSMGATVLDPTPYLTDDKGLCPVVIDGRCIYRDSNHLTVSGAKRLVPLFKQGLREAIID